MIKLMRNESVWELGESPDEFFMNSLISSELFELMAMNLKLHTSSP